MDAINVINWYHKKLLKLKTAPFQRRKVQWRKYLNNSASVLMFHMEHFSVGKNLLQNGKYRMVILHAKQIFSNIIPTWATNPTAVRMEITVLVT